MLGENLLGEFLLGEDVEENFDQLVTDALIITETYTLNALINNLIEDNLTVSESISKTRIFNRTVTDSLTLSEKISKTYELSTDDSLTLSEDISGGVVKVLHDNLTITEEITVSKTINRTRSDTLIVTELRSVDKTLNLTVSDFGEISEHIFRPTKVYTRLVSDALTINDEIYHQRFVVGRSDALSISEIYTGKKVVELLVADQLEIIETVSRNVTLSLLVTDTLELKTGYQKPVNVGGVETIFIPEIQVIKIKPKRITILQGNGYSITLPAPEFGDEEANQSELKILRFKTGGKRIYRQSSDKYKLNYEFVVNRLKAYELKQFILNQNAKTITMTNFKGEKWFCIMTNNPFIFSEIAYWEGSCGNKFTIPLEFEGIKLL